MSVFSISYHYGANKTECLVIGDQQSIMSTANILECNKIQFKVADVRGFYVKQNELGFGGFYYWLDQEEKFT